ncbi:hypothetical protein PFISCL1PPCAC_24132 [Pristionchus fissidentatus]|uniref:Rubicon Homology domain-containing protein n=1 Tax=Pristionchus fissidentatus TaxID=1538716 RepID=A0AAV5WQN5_9BILA|nr:hypothetical protein PFISCL1PPCAC_24132 [Pristionchus fissidentatus]
MSSFFPFLTSTPRKGSTSTESVTLDSSAIDVDRISFASSNGSTVSEEQLDDTSDLYMSVRASPTGSGEEESFLTAGSIKTGTSIAEKKSNDQKLLYRPTSLFPDGPAWLDLQKEIVQEREQRLISKSDDVDLFDLASLVSGVREELRWKKSLANNERLKNLMAELDDSYNPLEGPSTSDNYSDLSVRLKTTPAMNSVVIPSPAVGIGAVEIEKTMKVPPHEIVQRALLHDHSTVFPRDEVTNEWLTRVIDHSNMLLAPPISSISPSTSINRSITTASSVSRGIDDVSQSTVGGQIRVRDEWILELHPTRAPHKILELQGYKCADCGRFLEGEYAKRIRYCEYYGAVFCFCCSSTGKGVVPARVLYAWNFREFPLSDRAAAFLGQVRDKPIIRIREAAPSLVEKIRSLKLILSLRPRLRHASTYIKYCGMAARTRVNGGTISLSDLFSSIPSHLIDFDDVFSLDDLERLRNGDLLSTLEGAFALAKSHVESCLRPDNELISVCKDRAFTCWLCSSDSDLIFPFQSDRAHRCEACGSAAHINCFRKAQKDNRGFEPECAKCKRMQESRIRRRFISTCDD